jgi:hypothetical protein
MIKENKAALNPLQHKLSEYIPLFIVFAFIALSSWIYLNLTSYTLLSGMNAVMGFFFLYFSLFKFLNLPGFAQGYQEYDLIAHNFKLWGWFYPFIEIGLATLFLLKNQSMWLYIATIIITLINVTGVGIKLAKREKFMCLCLGTILKVPLTTVSLIEYAVMGLMAVIMLFFI